jgi:hypothetical protein
MQRTVAPNSSAGLHVDKVPGVTIGTTGIALDRNNLQEEIVNTILGAGLTLGAAQTQLMQAIAAMIYPIGRRVEMMAPLTPGTFVPVVRIDDADHDVDTTHYLALVTALRAIKLQVNSTTDFTGTVAGSVITLATTTAGDKWLAALAEEQAVHGSYTAWLCINIAGTDYVITNVNAGARTITVTGTPTSGSQTAIIYPYRIAGSSTTARLRRDSARAFVGSQQETADTTDRALCVGMRVRDREQGHWHTEGASNQWGTASGGGTGYNFALYLLNVGSVSNPLAGQNGPVGSGRLTPSTDGTNGTPRTGLTTDPRTTVGYLYLGAGVYN